VTTRFVGHLLLSPEIGPSGRPVLQGGRTSWVLEGPFGWGDVLVPAGATTDLASIPRPVWSLFPPDGEWVEAAVVHDYLYRTKGLQGRYSRAQADAVLRDAMADLGVAGWKRAAIYAAVRIGGKGGWGS
jgi:hypothetical protein